MTPHEVYGSLRAELESLDTAIRSGNADDESMMFLRGHRVGLMFALALLRTCSVVEL